MVMGRSREGWDVGGEGERRRGYIEGEGGGRWEE